MNRRIYRLILPLAAFSFLPAYGQVQGQPPFEACKPGGFAVIGYPDEFGPGASPAFDVVVDERFRGNFLTQERNWIPDIASVVRQWNGISSSEFEYRLVDTTTEDPDPFDGRTTIAACGFSFGCPTERPPAPPSGPGGDVIDFFGAPQTTLAVTLIVQDNTFEKGIGDSDIFFNPGIPFELEPSTGQIDFKAVLLHELGHALGLDHNDNCGGSSLTVMESVVDLGESIRVLNEPELEGARFLYPNGDRPSIRIFDNDRTLHFDAVEGGLPPFDQSVRIFSLNGRRWSAAAADPWVTVELPNGIMDAREEIQIIIDQTGLAPGNYQTTVTLAAEDVPGGPEVITVNLAVQDRTTTADLPLVSSSGVVNGANLGSQRLAPGSIVTIFGQNLSVETAQAQNFPVPTTLAGSQVVINGTIAPLLYVSPTQINAIVPSESVPGRGGLIVRSGIGQNRWTPFDMTAAAPELFLIGDDRAIALNQDGSLNGPDNPAAPGSVLSLFFTGQGPVDPPVPTGQKAPFGPFALVTSDSSVSIGGVDTGIRYLGLAPGFAGLAQANVALSEGVTGRLPVTITIAGEASNTAFVWVQ